MSSYSNNNLDDPAVKCPRQWGARDSNPKQIIPAILTKLTFKRLHCQAPAVVGSAVRLTGMVCLNETASLICTF